MSKPIPIPSRPPTTEEISLVQHILPSFNLSSPNWEMVKGELLAHGIHVQDSTSLDSLMGTLRELRQRRSQKESARTGRPAAPGAKLPEDPVTLKDMAKLGRVTGAMKNWGISGRPEPWRMQSGRRPAIYSYAELRAWFIEKQPDRAYYWPESFAEMRATLAKLSR